MTLSGGLFGAFIWAIRDRTIFWVTVARLFRPSSSSVSLDSSEELSLDESLWLVLDSSSDIWTGVSRLMSSLDWVLIDNQVHARRL